MKPEILYEDGHLLVALKEPRILSQADRTGDTDMLSLLKVHLRQVYPKARNPYLGLVHRLDRPVGGLMVFAKTKAAAAFLSKQLQERGFNKTYYAIVCGRARDEARLVDYLKKDGRLRASRVVTKDTKGAKEALLSYRALAETEDKQGNKVSLLAVELETGRHHQIRVQLAAAGLPLWGDTKYNPDFRHVRGWQQLGLWAGELEFVHPRTREMMSFYQAPPTIHPFTLFPELRHVARKGNG